MVEGALDYEGRFRVSRGSFFQVNRFLLDRLVTAGVGDDAGQTALDLYAGAGLFSLALARKFVDVIAVESGSAAARDLQFNAERAGLSNVRVEQGLSEDFLERLERAPDFVFVDPPRAGLGKRVVECLTQLSPPQLVIVSCDPATLARDLAGLVSGGYRIQNISLVDLFPQTYHLEAVVRLSSALH
jgi:23S rRNA (uracil1939-C5)-methyltransferase